jgi:hypothetical protein
VPGLGEIGNTAQQQRETGLGDVVAPRGEVAGGEVERARGCAVRVVHPDVPDALFGGFGIGAQRSAPVGGTAVEEGRSVDRPPRAVIADQSKNLNQWPILVEIARRGCERTEQCAVVQKAPGHQVHHLAVALDHTLYAEQARAEQLARCVSTR